MPKQFNALIRACKYSAIPNQLGYCGPKDCFKQFNDFIENPSKEKAESVKESLAKFSALYPYLELIASSHDLSPFDEEVVEAYWIGSHLLEGVQKRELQKTVLSLQMFGLPRSIAESKATAIKEGMFPHHSFHVLFVNFINPKVKPLVSNLGNCLIQWAEIKEPGETLRVKGVDLISESGELKLREKIKSLENPFKIDAKKKDLVSVHWGKVVEKISADQVNTLKKFTFKNFQ